MLQAQAPSSPFSTSYTPTAPFGRPKRGTPDYAAAVRQQIARLAALHAAAVAEAPPPPAVAIKSVLVVSPCPRLRALVKSSLSGTEWVRVVESESAVEAEAQMIAELPDLMLVDHSQSVLLSRCSDRSVLIADQVPRSADLPGDLAGVLARPLKAERVARYVVQLLEQQK